MSTAVVKKEASLPRVNEAPSQEILSSDILIPKILLMQGLSELVSERKAQLGDLVRSTTGEKLGSVDQPVDFVPLKMTSEWAISERIGGKFEWRGSEPRTAANENLPWEFKDKGTDWKRTKVLNVFGLLPGDISGHQEAMKGLKDGDLPDLDKSLLPVVVSFRSTSFHSGKKVATFFAQVQDMVRYQPGLKSYQYSLSLGAYADKNDKGNFFVLDILGKAKKLDVKLLPEVERWYAILQQMSKVRVDNSDLNESAELAQSHF